MAATPDAGGVRPGIVPLCPLGVGNILGGALWFVVRHPVVTIGTTAVVLLAGAGVLTAALFALDGFRLVPEYGPLAAIGVFAVAGLYWLIVGSVVSATHLIVLGHAVRGRRERLVEVWSAALRRAPGLMRAHLLGALVVAAAVAFGALPIVLASATGNRLTGLPPLSFLVGACVVGGVVAISLLMAGPVQVLEDVGMGAAFSRSREFMRGTFRRVAGVLLLAVLVVQGVWMAGRTIGVLGMSAVEALVGAPQAAPLWVVAAGTGVVLAAAVPFFAGVVGLLHVDRRIRWERFGTRA